MDSEHPYQPPAAALDGPAMAGASHTGDVSEATVQTLIKTRPWVLLMGIVVLLGCALMVVMALFMMLAGGLAGLNQVQGMGAFGGMMLGGFYMVLAAVYLVPGIHLIRYSGAIKVLKTNPTHEGVEKALKAQLSFWRFVGIVTVAFIALYGVIIVGAIVVAIATTAGG